ncbi:MAG: tRNA ((7)-)-methyltransferase [Paenibacillus sp.]|jgi:tRNA (guanine-N7-)-methyltransferase|uniref:tRNA (guanosine(46)-N7)-methyltransferase TrmB n=1 Tax=Paenibacillus sp. GCM10012303 TaxID=3317340 RepID=UPI0029EC64BC|nr:tRNA ((7)-)-methyltransferase [Paenibacillus sp.]
MRLRGRKGIREEIERQNDLVVLEPQQWKGRWSEWFGNDKPIYVELGMGKGKFISGMSVQHPDCNFIGVDMYDELIRRASDKARVAAEREDGSAPDNLALALFNIERIEEMFAEAELRRIYLNFSDPWPKKKHARRRLTHPGFITKYIRLLDGRGEIHFKTDSRSLFEFSLNSFADMNIRLRNISLDLHKDGPAPNNVMTEYETKFSEQNMPIYRLEAVIGSDALAEHERLLKRPEASV